MLKLLKSKRGEGYIDVCVLVLCAMLVIALAVQVLRGTTLHDMTLTVGERAR